MSLKLLKQSSHKGFQQQSRVVAEPVQKINQRSELLTSLGKFSNASAAAATTSMQQEVEADKIVQTSRAAEDLLRSEDERKGISSGSTKAGQLAYNMIVGKHDTMEAGNKFIDWYSTNPDASGDDIAKQKEALYKPLLAKYGTDKHTLKAISLQVQKSQFSLTQAQDGISKKYKSKKADEALTISISDMLADPNADIDHLINKEIPQRAKVLGKDEFDYKKQLLTQASLTAKNGDNRLLESLKKEDWSKNSPSLVTAQRAYDITKANNNASAIGTSMADIENQALTGNVSWGVTERRMDAVNKEYPHTYTALMVKALKAKKDKAANKADRAVKINEASTKPLTDQNAIPLGDRTDYTKKEKDDLIKSKDIEWADKTKSLVDNGVDQSDANTSVLKDKLDWSRVNRLVIPSLQQNFNSLIDMNPDETTGNDLPTYAKGALQVLKMMDDSSLSMYFPDKSRLAMANNIKSGMKNHSDYESFKRAYDIRRNPFSVSNTQKADQRDAVSNEVDNELERSWYQAGKSVPEWQRNLLSNTIGNDAQSSLYHGSQDVDRNASTSAKTILSRYSQTFNNTLINKTAPEIAQAMGFDKDNKGDVNSYFKYFSDAILPSLIKEEPDITTDDLQFVMNDTSQTFIIKDSNNEQVGGRFTIEDLRTLGRSGIKGHISEERKESIKDRDTRIAKEGEDREYNTHMAMFYAHSFDNK